MAGRMSAMTSGKSAPDAVRVAVLLALLALAGYLLVRLVLGVVSPESRYRPVQLAAPAPVQAATAQDFDFSYNPFAAGDVETDIDAAPVETAPDTQDAPETTLDLTLTGLRAGQNGSAFIRRPDGETDNYYVADEVLGGVYLREVHPDHIILEVNGQVQKLTSEDAKAARRESAGTTRPATDQKLSTLGRVDVADLMQKFNVTVRLDGDGNRIGAMLTPRSPGVKLSDYGLQSGDIVTSIAGQSLTTGFPNPIAISQAIQPGRPVTVQLIRDGAPQTITLG